MSHEIISEVFQFPTYVTTILQRHRKTDGRLAAVAIPHSA